MCTFGWWWMWVGWDVCLGRLLSSCIRRPTLSALMGLGRTDGRRDGRTDGPGGSVLLQQRQQPSAPLGHIWVCDPWKHADLHLDAFCQQVAHIRRSEAMSKPWLEVNLTLHQPVGSHVQLQKSAARTSPDLVLLIDLH